MPASATVTSNLSGSVLTLTDTSSSLPTITSRVLTIFNAAGTLLDTINMGANLTQDYDITQDQYITFVLTLNSGAYTVEINYLQTNFYYNALVNEAKSNCGCCDKNLCSDSAKAMMAVKGAEFYTEYGFAVNADRLIKAADTLIL